jgi:SAM-dependent methyltransferase
MMKNLGRKLRSAVSRVQRELSRPRGPYPISIEPIHPHAAASSPTEGVETFDSEEARALNQARLDHLDSLGLDLAARSVLDVGAGVGHLAQFFVKKGARVVCLEGRRENIARMAELYPEIEGRVFDIERDELNSMGTFDVVLCYGLIYHLENPFRAIRALADVSRELLLIETIILDHKKPLLLMDEETATFSQAIRGIGCRPTPSFVALALRESGFANIYAPRTPIDHPHYRFRWTNSLQWRRRQRLMRAIFVASRKPLSSPGLARLI